jgi:hypothetical protein
MQESVGDQAARMAQGGAAIGSPHLLSPSRRDPYGEIGFDSLRFCARVSYTCRKSLFDHRRSFGVSR